ncbi:hypothetical protein GCM10007420_00480 [Glycocaulis albus]|uniref:DUF2868 domain-containing protein n=2 Tax=Glycocaulis albus TaxID=1382801 RepID=A0ABQ1XE79_9PROT|nr:hypothetical protein GCM10007420_00480 [Glycocaulis albus]
MMAPRETGMSLTDKEKAVLAKAGFGAGVIRAAEDEAGRFVSLPMRRLFGSFWFQTGFSMAIVLATAVFGAGVSNGFFSAFVAGLMVIFPLMLIVSMAWLSARQLRHESPERWAARKLVVQSAGGGHGALEGLTKLAERASAAGSTHQALRLIAGTGTEPSARPDWMARALIAGLITGPILLVVAVPLILSHFGY